ncbi:hypothetical protein FUSO7_12540 [Fusobacterium necrophorum BFTR-2]|nr:alcohol dehydrogenase catalytic domain-containing protein [Fusobacterium necrophorum]KDE68849.1 hypothetical protein FUSO7_12540 [Fusobacterium necrophorum BFTR-2]
MNKMKQVWFTEENKIEICNVEIPSVEFNQVKIKIAYASICATDVHMVTMGVMGAKPPIPLGHEASGTIVEIDEHAKKSGLKVGDKVCLFPISTCNICEFCKSGKHQYCVNPKGIGAFAEYVVTDVSAVYKIPDNANLKHYSLVEPTNCVLRALDLVSIKAGSNVAISGIGGIGSIMLKMILLSGAANITVIEPIQSKRENALKLGVNNVINPLTEDIVEKSREITKGRGYDYIFEMSGVPSAAYPALKTVAKCGTVIYFAVYPPNFEMSLNLYELYMKEARIQTVFTDPEIMPRSINMINRLNMDDVIGKVMPLSNALEAIELFNKSIYPKIILDCSK